MKTLIALSLAVAPLSATAEPVESIKTAPVPQKIHRTKRPAPAIGRVASATRDATREPVRAGFQNAVQIYPFAEGAVYRLYAAPGAITDIALQPGENLGAVAVGDTARWVVGDTSSGSGPSRRTHILIKPFSAGLRTNLVITTDRRVYHLAMTATERTAMAGLSWTYPAEGLISLTGETDGAAAGPLAGSGSALEQLDFGYRISGDDPPWRPLRAFDDGRQTYVEFPASLAVGEAPPLFARGRSGEAELVNYRTRGRFYIVDGLFPQLELRLGLKKQTIVRISRHEPKPTKGRGS